MLSVAVVLHHAITVAFFIVFMFSCRQSCRWVAIYYTNRETAFAAGAVPLHITEMMWMRHVDGTCVECEMVVEMMRDEYLESMTFKKQCG
jgi:hypothetical protein